MVENSNKMKMKAVSDFYQNLKISGWKWNGIDVKQGLGMKLKLVKEGKRVRESFA